MQSPTKRHPLAVIETSKGVIKFVLYPEIAPKTVANFIRLVKSGFYNGIVFHRVEPGFVIQGGDPKTKGSSQEIPSISNEKNGPLRHNRGAVGMANAGRDTASSQFYIVISKPAPNLDATDPDGMSKYTLFGQVVDGQAVAEKITVGDKIVRAKVLE